MPVIRSIAIKNFKGASSVQIELAGKVTSPVITLIGLNESGKTTILEALSYFVSEDSSVSSIFEGVHSKAAINALIPINRKAAFTDVISITAKIEFTKSDVSCACAVAKDNGYEIDAATFPPEVEVSQIYRFVDSVRTKNERLWAFKFNAKGKRQKQRTYDRPSGTEERNLWSKVVTALGERIPSIAYFPTFLVDMPARIYLKEHEDERPVNRLYRSVLQDVLNSIDGDISLEKHVCKRIEDFKASKNDPAWISFLFGAPSKSQIDSVFQKISNAVTKEVIGSWGKVFQRPVAAKLISLEWNVDTQKDDLPYASFFVSDGESKYSVSERSLGFRWFFSFLLFTAFKRATSRPTLFLFDEPAANLHAKAQAELLKSFSKITNDGNQIIYSTHSHHMINPQWLSGAYIVENTAVDYDSDDAFGLSTKPTNIIATRYRQFVSKYPARTSYFQPVIEQLEYVAPELIGEPPFLIVEGITDYYALRLVQEKATSPISIMPGCGAGASGALISWLLGRGEKFFLLTDDDTAGRTAANRYRDEWFLTSENVQTLGELVPNFKGKRLEGLLSSDTKQAMKAAAQKSGSMTKKEIGLFLAEACATGTGSSFMSQETQDNFLTLLNLASQQISKQ